MEYDLAIFKILSSNDTSAAPGHQGGIVVPKDLAAFFPGLLDEVTSESPTVESFIDAELWNGPNYLGTARTRYQHQTWGARRSPERRLTSNLGPVRDLAAAGDALLFQRSLSDHNRMKLTLVKAGSALFNDLASSFGKRRWGTLTEVPASNAELKEGEVEVAEKSNEVFQLFADSIDRHESRVQRIARDRAFRLAVLGNFGSTCAVTGRSLVSPSGQLGLDAAHIVPLGYKGTNDIRNGLALSKEIHWAFDLGLLAIDGGAVVVANRVKADSRNFYLAGFDGTNAHGMRFAKVAPSKDALAWHREHVFLSG